MTVKIYGPTASRAARALWIVHELGIPFEHVAMEMKDLKNADYLKINPNGKVPALVDGDFKLFEFDGDQPLSRRQARQGRILPGQSRGPGGLPSVELLGHDRGREAPAHHPDRHVHDGAGQAQARGRRRGAEGAAQAVRRAERRAAGPRLSARLELHCGRPQPGVDLQLGQADQVRLRRPSPRPAPGSTVACRGRPTRRRARRSSSIAERGPPGPHHDHERTWRSALPKTLLRPAPAAAPRTRRQRPLAATAAAAPPG